MPVKNKHTQGLLELHSGEDYLELFIAGDGTIGDRDKTIFRINNPETEDFANARRIMTLWNDADAVFKREIENTRAFIDGIRRNCEQFLRA